MSEPPTHWWQTGVVYQIYPRSFADGNGDGVGDLWGATEQLDYLEWLGIDAVWLSPHFPSPQADFGYDVSDYTDVEPEYGTLDMFQHFLGSAHDRGIRVLLDLVLNHTSNQHRWFLESRSSPDNPKHDWYMWHPGAIAANGTREPPNNWLSAFGGPGWTWDETRGEWYYHYFLAEQPDLNWRNPAVAEAMWDAVRFWLDRGVDGFRLDAIATLFEHEGLNDHDADFSLIELWSSRYERNARLDAIPSWETMFGDQLHQPEVHRVLSDLRRVIDEYDDRVLVGETDRLEYCGADQLQMVFNFPLTRMEQLTPQAIRANQRARFAAMPEGAWPCNTMGNHDAHRARSRLADGVNDEAWARVAAALTLLLPGTPSLYQGEEIGMEDYLTTDPTTLLDPIGRWFYQAAIEQLGMEPTAAAARAARFSRDRTRTPMQWSDGANAGFSPEGVKTWLPVHPNHRTGVNVADQRIDASSLLAFYQRLIHFRRDHVALQEGGYEEILLSDDQILAFLRTHPAERLLVAINLGPNPAELTVGPHYILWRGDAPAIAPATADDVTVAGFGLAIAELIDPAAESLRWRRTDPGRGQDVDSPPRRPNLPPMRHIVPLVALLLILSACSPNGGSETNDGKPPIGPGTTAPPPSATTTTVQPATPLAGLGLELIADGFDQPTYATSLPGDDRIFVLEKTGLVRILNDGVVAATPFLDLSAEVSTKGPEQGLTALVFHPRYEENGRLFVFFTDVAGDSQLFEYQRSSDNLDAADPRSGRRIIELEQPHPAHQGGAIVFGPDGYLWVTLGDGGVPSPGGTDWRLKAQDPTNWYGTVLRLDIDAASPYAIPPDNPFATGEGGAPEVWAYGLRNPWRATVDGDSILISDVGQDWWEEVNVIPLVAPGGNYGWPILEGPECFEAKSCYTAGLIEPSLTEYHEGLCAIIAGPVYRGPSIPELHGHQFYSDYCVGWFRSWAYAEGVESSTDWTGDLGKIGNASSFGVDGNGEMLIMNLAGQLYRIVAVR